MSDYRPFDQDKWLLTPPPWHPNNPALVAWEAAHGHDFRIKCYPEFGCLAIGYEADDLREQLDNIYRDNVVINKASFTRKHPTTPISDAPGIAYSELEAVVVRLREEAEEYRQLITRQGDLLTGVANGLRGDPPANVRWDHSDLPVRAAAMAAELRAAQVRIVEMETITGE